MEEHSYKLLLARRTTDVKNRSFRGDQHHGHLQSERALSSKHLVLHLAGFHHPNLGHLVVRVQKQKIPCLICGSHKSQMLLECFV